jgi:ribosomal protein S18 acetylase RimI-like enzyme
MKSIAHPTGEQSEQEIHIRRVFLREDADQIQLLQLDAPEFNRHYPRHLEWLKMALHEVVEGRRFAFGVYKPIIDSGIPKMVLIGSIILKKETYSHVMQLKNLYIDPKEREKHYGRKLYQAVEQFCLKRGCTSIETEVPFEERRTVSFLTQMGFMVQNLVDSPYRKGDRIYRMFKSLPAKYTGDPFDLFRISTWLFENQLGFRVVDCPVVSEIEGRFIFETTSQSNALQIKGLGYVWDSPVELSAQKVKDLQKEKKYPLIAVVSRRFSSEALKLCEANRIRTFELSSLERDLRTSLSLELPLFSREEIRGIIVRLNSKYEQQILASNLEQTYFKGGPIGKYLKNGYRIFFFIEDSPNLSSGGVKGYAQIKSCSVGNPQSIWKQHENHNPVFPEPDYQAWSVDKDEVVALTFSGVQRISTIPFERLKSLIGNLDAEILGHFYLNEIDVNRLLDQKQNFQPLTGLDHSRHPLVFVSSTIEDLEQEREAIVRLTKERLTYNVYAAEWAGAQQKSRQEILTELARSQVYVLVVGERYGHEVEYKGRQISATHEEFLAARESGKPTLVYVKNVTNREKKVEIFLREIGEYDSGVKYQKFSTLAELENHILQDIAKLMAEALSRK